MDSEKNCITVTKCSNALVKHTMDVCAWADFESDFVTRANERTKRETGKHTQRERTNETKSEKYNARENNDDTIML